MILTNHGQITKHWNIIHEIQQVADRGVFFLPYHVELVAPRGGQPHAVTISRINHLGGRIASLTRRQQRDVLSDTRRRDDQIVEAMVCEILGQRQPL